LIEVLEIFEHYCDCGTAIWRAEKVSDKAESHFSVVKPCFRRESPDLSLVHDALQIPSAPGVQDISQEEVHRQSLSL